MNLTYLPPLANHLWQSTVFAGVAVLLMVALRRNHARVRHWVWLAASCKFLIPLSLLIALGAHIQWRTAPEISRFVTDASGLTKKYDFTLTFADSASPGPTPEASEPMPDIFAAVQSQFGLKLERKPIPVDVFVVDHMARTPLGN